MKLNSYVAERLRLAQRISDAIDRIPGDLKILIGVVIACWMAIYSLSWLALAR